MEMINLTYIYKNIFARMIQIKYFQKFAAQNILKLIIDLNN